MGHDQPPTGKKNETMVQGSSWPFIITLLALAAGVIDDLRSRKVHNSLILKIFCVATLASLVLGGPSTIFQIVSAIIGAFVFCLPLYLTRTLGGGDVKLLIAISPLWGWADIGALLVYSLIWGAILGVFSIVLKGQLKPFLGNLLQMAIRNPVQKHQLHKIPYTVAMFFGFLTFYSLAERGITLL